jgi:peptide/nickel transport system permease protein
MNKLGNNGKFWIGAIAIFALLAILAPVISPDRSENANSQNLYLAKTSPFTTIYSIHYGDNIFYTTEFAELASNELRFKALNDGNTRTLLPDTMEQQLYILGTDKFGRDLLSRLLGGARISLAVGFLAVCISLFFGLSLGLIAGYFGGWPDKVISWIINVVWSVPTLLLVIGLTVAFGKGLFQVFIAVGLTMWIELARVTRGQVISLKEKEFVIAAKLLGMPQIKIFWRYILPQLTGVILVLSAANFSTAILLEAGLSFLGIGAQIPTPTWGGIIKNHFSLISTEYAFIPLLAGGCIMMCVMAFMQMSNALQQFFDKRSQ